MNSIYAIYTVVKGAAEKRVPIPGRLWYDDTSTQLRWLAWQAPAAVRIQLDGTQKNLTVYPRASILARSSLVYSPHTAAERISFSHDLTASETAEMRESVSSNAEMKSSGILHCDAAWLILSVSGSSLTENFSSFFIAAL